MATINVLDAAGATVAVEKPLAPGAAAAAASYPMTLSTENLAALANQTKQDTANTALANILAKLLTAPSTEAKQDTANTVLNNLLTATGAVSDAAWVSGNGNVIMLLKALLGEVATEAKQDTGNTSLATAVTTLDGLLTAATSTAPAKVIGNAAHGAVGTGIDPVITGGIASDTPPANVDANDAAWGWHLRNGATVVAPFSEGATVAASVTRPADTTAYSANDVIGGALTFSSVARSGAAVMILGASVRADVNAVPAWGTGLRLHLFNVTPPSALADNAQFLLPSGDRASYLGFVDVGTLIDMGDTCLVANDELSKLVKLSGTSLFGYLTTPAGGATTASTAVTVTLNVVPV